MFLLYCGYENRGGSENHRPLLITLVLTFPSFTVRCIYVHPFVGVWLLRIEERCALLALCPVNTDYQYRKPSRALGQEEILPSIPTHKLQTKG